MDETELQIDHRVPFEINGEPRDFNIGNFMLLSNSANRTKSWNCENCINFKKLREREICLSCYWAYPENYSHIAMNEIRRVDLIWKNDEIKIYNKIKQNAEKSGKEIQELIKKILEKC